MTENTAATEYADKCVRELKILEAQGGYGSTLTHNIRTCIRNAIESIEYEVKYAREHYLK